MCVCMGGRVAEELIYGKDKVTTGAQSDIQTATKIAENMVRQCGMGSENVGYVQYSGESQKEGWEYSEATKAAVEGEVRALVQEAYNTAREILTTNVDELHVIADSLLRHETMTGKELEMAIQEHKESKRPVPNPAASFLAQTAAVST
mmetsp:Transcript_72089/g.120944  ORF Transcript_72089/g.120944 Transcript_72089/m.120944 type:complete len:148 (+) Transcript_72089:2-445(+)